MSNTPKTGWWTDASGEAHWIPVKEGQYFVGADDWRDLSSWSPTWRPSEDTDPRCPYCMNEMGMAIAVAGLLGLSVRGTKGEDGEKRA